MPKKKNHSRRQEERWISRRVRHEMRKRQLKAAEFSRRLEAVGCYLDGSALHKILKDPPERGITANELGAFAQVLEVPVGDLCRPLELALADDLNELLEELQAAREILLPATAEFAAIVKRLVLFATENRELTYRLMDAVKKQGDAMVTLFDIALEVEADLRGDDAYDYPDPFEKQD